MSKKILVVEDNSDFQNLYQEELEGKEVFIIKAFTIEEADTCFAAHPEIDLIVMDFGVPGNEPNTVPLVKRVRKTFKGPMIASSSGVSSLQKLVEAGCSGTASKFDVSKVVISELHL